MSQYVDATAGAVEHCEAMSKEFPDLAETFYTPMADACRQKLWHQLTLLVLEFVARDVHKTARMIPEHAQIGAGTHNFLALYDKVITRVDSKLHPLLLAKIASHVANALIASDVTAAKAVLENLIANKKDTIGIPATIFVESKLALLVLNTTKTSGGSGGGDASMADDAAAASDEKTVMASVLQVLQANATKLEDMRMLTTQRPMEGGAGAAGAAASLADLASVFAAHYEASLTYYKRIGPPEAFYEQAMQFLNYAPPPPPPLPSSSSGSSSGSGDEAAAAASPVSSVPRVVDVTMISTTDYHQLAVDLCLAALTGDGVYNLGQVVEDQAVLLQYLKQPNNSEFYWLVELLQSVADGNVLLFDELTRHRYAVQIAGQPALVHRTAAVREKLTLLCLVWLVFQKASHERTLTFDELAQALHLQDCGGPQETGQAAAAKDRVEWVVMRALSVHLMEGFIDQVDQTVTVTWILPRVLNAEQMQSLANSFAEWAVKVRNTTDSITTSTTAHQQHPSSSSAAAATAATGVAAN